MKWDPANDVPGGYQATYLCDTVKTCRAWAQSQSLHKQFVPFARQGGQPAMNTVFVEPRPEASWSIKRLKQVAMHRSRGL